MGDGATRAAIRAVSSVQLVRVVAMATMIPLAVLAGQAIAQPAGVRIDRSWVFEREEHRWRRIPPETGASHDAQAVFTVFFPGGELAQVSGWVFRTRAGRVSLCMGCGFAVWRGTWTRTGTMVKTRLVLRSSAIQQLDPATNQPVQPVREETWTLEDGGARGPGRRLITPDGRHVPLSPRFDDFERLQALAQP
jgi:hypothetical protein